MKGGMWGLLAGAILLAILYVLVRPKLPNGQQNTVATDGINAVTTALSDMISLSIHGLYGKKGS